MKFRFFAAVAAAALSIGASAHAAIDARQILTDYNLIVLDSLNNATADSEGAVYVGGDINGSSTYVVNGQNDAIGSLGGTLVVGGNVNAPVTLQSGAAVIGGSINNTFNANGGATVATGVPIDVAGIKSAFLNLSSELSVLDGTANVFSGDMNNRVIEPVAGADGIAVLNTDASIFVNQNSLSFSNALTTVVNISTGGTINIGEPFKINNEFSNVIFNFYNADEVNISVPFGASVLAASADVTIAGTITGSVVAENILRMSAQTHIDTFSGDLPSPVPLPAGVWLMGTGIAGLAAARRRRQSKAAA